MLSIYLLPKRVLSEYDSSPTLHPFIAMLAVPKGKKAMPRVFRHIDEQQRITILTLIAIHLDSLDVIAGALPDPTRLTAKYREEVELYSQTIMPSLFSVINDSPLQIITGVLNLIIDRTTIQLVSRTKPGISFLTMLISRAEIIKQATPDLAPEEWSDWTRAYNRLFDAIEPCLPLIFTTSVHDADDVYVWQYLAAMGVGASPEQQQRLVLGVKDRVMETVEMARSKATPKDLSALRLGHVNLFMRAIGLDVELLS
jgi:DNA topoisomerase 2-associated protein PAT1